jgi:hypothetical protein
LGNHDYFFLEWLKNNDEKYSSKTFIKLKKKLEENPEILEYLKSLPLYIEEDNFILIHL